MDKQIDPLAKAFSKELVEKLSQEGKGILYSWIEIEEIDYKQHILKGKRLMKNGKLSGIWKLTKMAEEALRELIEEKEIEKIKAIKVYISNGDILDILESV